MPLGSFKKSNGGTRLHAPPVSTLLRTLALSPCQPDVCNSPRRPVLKKRGIQISGIADILTLLTQMYNNVMQRAPLIYCFVHIHRSVDSVVTHPFTCLRNL